MSILRECDLCQITYSAEPRYLNRGQGVYCSKSCSVKGSSLKRVKVKEPNVVCAYCKVTFYMNNSKQKNSKSGLFFCSREHKDISQRIGGIKEIQPPHYSDGSRAKYRQTAHRFLDMSQCSKCFYKKYPEVLQVNHIDCNRSNNDVSNLEVLCPTCHMEYHFTTKTGPWGARKK